MGIIIEKCTSIELLALMDENEGYYRSRPLASLRLHFPKRDDFPLRVSLLQTSRLRVITNVTTGYFHSN